MTNVWCQYVDVASNVGYVRVEFKTRMFIRLKKIVGLGLEDFFRLNSRRREAPRLNLGVHATLSSVIRALIT